LNVDQALSSHHGCSAGAATCGLGLIPGISLIGRLFGEKLLLADGFAPDDGEEGLSR
jgi:hypothetical protein